MSKKKTVILERDGFRTVWQNGKGEVLVDVFESGNEVPILEWAYPKVPGLGHSLLEQASFWIDQAILEAKRVKEAAEFS